VSIAAVNEKISRAPTDAAVLAMTRQEARIGEGA
jgi:hypothetical protein